MKNEIKETVLFDETNTQAAINVSLKDVAAFIQKLFSGLDVTVHYNDYDDYGCEHYVLIKGICADIKLEKHYGGAYSPDDYIVGSISSHFYRDNSSRISHQFNTKESVEELVIRNDYTNLIKQFVSSSLPYLTSSASLFQRTEYRYDNNNAICGIVSDDDFYTDKQNNSSVPLVQSSELHQQEEAFDPDNI